MRLKQLLAVAAAFVAGAALAQSFDNASIIALHDAGLGDQAIIAKIDSVPCGYDVSTDGLVSLKRRNISDEVIAAMLRRCSASTRAQGIAAGSADPAVARAPGIYLLREWARPADMVMLRPSKASGVTVSGNGSVLFPYVGKVVLPDLQSSNVVNGARPTFYFYFSPGDRKVSDFGTSNSTAAQSPDEFSLVRFRMKDNGRELVIGKMSAFSARRGVDPRQAIPFSSEEVGDSSFKVTIGRDLEPGEYAFVITGANNAARVYDFSVR